MRDIWQVRAAPLSDFGRRRVLAKRRPPSGFSEGLTYVERDETGRGEPEPEFRHSDPLTDAALDWFFTLQAHPDDPDLIARLAAWRRADRAHDEAFARVARAWSLPEMDEVARGLVDQNGYPPDRHGDAARRPAPPGRWAKVALAMAAVLVLALGVQLYPGLALRWKSDYATLAGARQLVVLPDGSRMTLNTASAVALNFDGATRSVTLLQGEAYFDVVRDTSRPFTVISTFSEVEVKGTAFSVRTDVTQDVVVLERGHVDVAQLPGRRVQAALNPGESIVATAAALSPIQKADPETSLAWLRGQLVFEDRPFDEVLDEIARYYGHTIIAANGRLAQVKVNGNYRLDDPERVVRSLATAADASVTRLPGGILLVR